MQQGINVLAPCAAVGGAAEVRERRRRHMQPAPRVRWCDEDSGGVTRLAVSCSVIWQGDTEQPSNWWPFRAIRAPSRALYKIVQTYTFRYLSLASAQAYVHFSSLRVQCYRVPTSAHTSHECAMPQCHIGLREDAANAQRTQLHACTALALNDIEAHLSTCDGCMRNNVWCTHTRTYAHVQMSTIEQQHSMRLPNAFFD
jgi:hypothetical protein